SRSESNGTRCRRVYYLYALAAEFTRKLADSRPVHTHVSIERQADPERPRPEVRRRLDLIVSARVDAGLDGTAGKTKNGFECGGNAVDLAEVVIRENRHAHHAASGTDPAIQAASLGRSDVLSRRAPSTDNLCSLDAAEGDTRP